MAAAKTTARPTKSTAGPSKMPKRIGVYEIGACIGRGGMGEVYRATHTILERPVAIKRLMPGRGVANDPDLEARFLREGRALAELSHQGIVGIHDLIERRNGELFMVLDLVDGFDLGSLIRDGGPLAPELAAVICLQLAAALDYAHARRIVHRDIKAANVMLARSGEVKLMDFGVARDDRLEQMTQTGLVVGTPMYVAPEVIRGEVADARSDLYALGALLYYMLSGQRLFEGAQPERLFHLIVAGRYTPLRRVAKETPRRLRRVVERLLEREPARRYQSGAELRRDLELYLADEGQLFNQQGRVVEFLSDKGHLTPKEINEWFDDQVAEPPPSPPPPRRLPKTLLGFSLGVLAAALGVVAWWFSGAPGLQSLLDWWST